MSNKRVVVLGAGLPGLSAAYGLRERSVATEVLERADVVGGLARTHERRGYRFDLGGCRFFAKSDSLRGLLRQVLGPDLLTVAASSRIYYRGQLYKYPLDPKDLVRGLGLGGAMGASWSLLGSRLLAAIPLRSGPLDLEQWLIREFGETLYHAFFHDYNEKVWGVPCHRLSAELASRRIRGLRLNEMVAKAAGLSTNADRGYRFLYPRFGIGQFGAKLGLAVKAAGGCIRLGATVREVSVRRARVERVAYTNEAGEHFETNGSHVISAIPLPRLLHLIQPQPPADVLASARSLVFRDLITVCLELDRERVTGDSWLYVPEPRIGFARLLEPKNWSDAMAPPGRTSLVAEYYGNDEDPTWAMRDQELIDRTIADLAGGLGLIDRREVLGGSVIRVKKAYPVYTTTYGEHLRRIQHYLRTITNLQTIGRGGMFKYHNVAHLVANGMLAAENVFGARHDLAGLEGNTIGQRGFFVTDLLAD